MASNNALILKGHLGSDPRIVTMSNGREVANIFIATNRRDYRDEAGKWHKREPQWNNVAVFIPKAIEVLKSAKKGDGFEVRASVEIREHSDKSTGEVRKGAEIVVNDRFEGHLVKPWSPKADKPSDT